MRRQNEREQFWIFASVAVLATLFVTSDAFAQATDQAVADAVAAIDEASCWLLYFTTGSYGMLLTSASMLGAVVASAYGANRTALQALVVAIGASLIGPTASLFFDYNLACDPNMFTNTPVP